MISVVVVRSSRRLEISLLVFAVSRQSLVALNVQLGIKKGSGFAHVKIAGVLSKSCSKT